MLNDELPEPSQFRIHHSSFSILFQHAVQGSNLPLPGLEAGVPPLELTAYRAHSVRREGVEPPMARRARGVTARCTTVMRPTREKSHRGRIRTFDPVRPRHVR
jgi:hypothetical protein